MKILICKNNVNSLFHSQRLVLMAGEKEAMHDLVATRFPELTEDVNDEKFKQIRDAATKDLEAMERQALDTKKSVNDMDKQADEKKLSEAKPNEKKAIEKENKQKEAARSKTFEDMKIAYGYAKTEALQSLDFEYEKLKQRKAKNAEALAEGISGVLLDRKIVKREKDADSDVASMLGEANFEFRGVTLTQYVEGKDGKPVAVKGKDFTLDTHSTAEAVGYMLKSIYMSEGPDAAKAKVAELRKLAEGSSSMAKWSPNAMWSADVSQDMIDKVFGKNGESVLDGMMKKFYLDPGKFDKNDFPKILGAAAGNMMSAEKFFDKGKGYDRHRGAYEKAVQEALLKGENAPSPTEWARKNAPEMLVESRDPKALITSILDTIPLPNKNSPKYADMVKRRSAIEYHLRGVLSAEPDKTKWDVLAKKTLADMTGQKESEFGFSALSTFDYKGLGAGREIYGDSGELLTENYKYLTSGLIRGADFAYAGKQVEVTKDGKKVTVDFVSQYKEYLAKELGENGSLYKEIDKADRARSRKFESLFLQYGKDIPKEEVQKLGEDYEAKLLDVFVNKLKRPGALWNEMSAAPKPTEVKTEETSDKGKKAAPKAAPSGAPSGAASGAPKAPAKKPTADGGAGKSKSDKPASDKPKATGKDVPVAGGKKGDKPTEDKSVGVVPTDAVVATVGEGGVTVEVKAAPEPVDKLVVDGIKLGYSGSDYSPKSVEGGVKKKFGRMKPTELASMGTDTYESTDGGVTVQYTRDGVKKVSISPDAYAKLSPDKKKAWDGRVDDKKKDEKVAIVNPPYNPDR